MQIILEALRKHELRIQLRPGSALSSLRWRLARAAVLQSRLISHRFTVFCAGKTLWSVDGQRFLELESLLREFLLLRLNGDPEFAKSVASQLLNVLKHCDHITYEEPGTAEAYALLHFLDRYHRFQLIFESLQRNKLMPMRSDGVKILDVGTGPGPSMYAVSDFYSNALPKRPNKAQIHEQPAFSIDYVERSHEFRNWLHQFTEFANYYSPTQNPWFVPFHHGTFGDFQDLEFNQKKVSWEQDDDGERIPIHYIRKHRFDLIVFSNFLTTKEQTVAFSREIENCARYLRNNGILVVVGAKSSVRKYKEVYEEVERTVVSGHYSNRNLIAQCHRVQITESVMGYSWKDSYGKRLKALTKSVLDTLHVHAEEFIAKEADDLMRNAVQPEYSRAIEWEVLVFRKKARPRKKAPNPSFQRTAFGGR